jgi:hypothetical protein
VRVRGSAGAGGVFASVVGIECCESGAPKGAERFQTGHEALGRGRLPPELALDAYLQVTTTERFTPYPSAIPLRPLTAWRATLCLLAQGVVHEHEGGHCLDDGDRARQDTGVMTAPGF